MNSRLLEIIHSSVILDQRLEREEHEAELKVNHIIKRNKLLEETMDVLLKKVSYIN